MAVKVVVDTNIWVSALVAPTGVAARLVDLWRQDKFKLVVSEQQIDELTEVLTRPRFLKYRIDEQETADLLESISTRSERITLKDDIKLCSDPDDDIFIEAAILGKARYLITGDKGIKNDPTIISLLHKHGVTVTSISSFLKTLAS